MSIVLFEPFTIRGITFRNRIAVSPMCQYSSIDGFANDWHLVHLGSRAVGGAGLVIMEATAVAPEGRITPDDMGLWKDEHIDFLQRITSFIHTHGAVPGIQLAHAGRKSSHASPWKGGKPLQDDTAWQTLAPSNLKYKETDPASKPMSIAEIQQLVKDFGSAAKRAVDAGFKVIEIHAAHGYLINEFLSPLSNDRTDEYGGSFEKRIRVLTEICDAVRSVIPAAMPLFVRISATDWVEGGWTIEDSIQLTNILKQHGVDLIDTSSGGNSPLQKIPVGPLYQVPFAEQIKKETGILTGAVGLITTATEANSIIAESKADIVLLARELLRDPYFPLHAAKELGHDINWPDQYTRAKRQ